MEKIVNFVAMTKNNYLLIASDTHSSIPLQFLYTRIMELQLFYDIVQTNNRSSTFLTIGNYLIHLKFSKLSFISSLTLVLTSFFSHIFPNSAKKIIYIISKPLGLSP